jgi:hypothetical protein
MGEKWPTKFCQTIRLPRNCWGFLTCRKAATWDRRLYFPSEGRHAEDLFARKIRRLWPGLKPRSWAPEASMLTTRPPKPLRKLLSVPSQTHGVAQLVEALRYNLESRGLEFGIFH